MNLSGALRHCFAAALLILPLLAGLPLEAEAQTPPPPGLRVSTSELEIREGSSKTFTVWLSSEPSHPVTVTLSSDNQDVWASFTYTAELIFNSGNWNTGRTIYVLTQKDDDAAEDTATITFRASSKDTNYNNASGTVTVTVRDRDTAGLRISRNAININEGGAGSFTAALTVKPTGGTVTVNVESSDEYVAGVSPGSLTFTARNWNRPRTVTVTGLHDNDKDDDTERLTLSSDHTGGSGEYGGVSGNVRVAVRDDDSYLHIPVVSISGASPVTEGNEIVFTVRRTLSVKEPLLVLLRVSENQDFVAASEEGNKMVTIPRGSSSATYTVPTTDDNPNEPDGTVTAELRGSSRPLGEPHYFFDDNSDSATVMVKDNKGMQPSQNTAPTVANPIPDRTARVGTLFNYQFLANTFNDADGDSMTYTATLSNGSAFPSWLSFNENTRRFSGTPASGDTGTITVRVTASDGNLSVSDDFDIMVVGTPPPNTPVVSISGGSPVTEGTAATFTVSRTGATGSSLTVLLTVSEDTTGGQDFVTSGNEGNNKQVVIPSGSRTETYTVPTQGDNTDEPNGAVTVSLRASNDYTRGGTSSAEVRVNDNDDPPPGTPVVSISGGSAVTEGGTATFTLTANPVPSANISVQVTVDGGSFAGVGQAGSRTVNIGTGGTGSLTVTTVNDNTDEPDGTITATVASGNGYSTHNTNGSASVAVSDNDGPQGSVSGGGPAGGGGGGGSGGGDDDSDTSPDREALLAIYEASGGDNWDMKRNWGRSDEPVSRWYGVTTDDNNRVVALYLDDNDLTGEVPVSSLQSLSELEELALWGNPELGETVPVGFEKQVERAVLRTINDDNGPQGGISGWFPEDGSDVSDYSGWEGVTVDTNGRVSELDLSNEGLSKDITEALSELLVLETLDLSDNSDLEGELPPGLMDTQLMELDISGTGICVPDNEEFIMWLEEIDFTDTDSCVESEPMEPVDSEPAESSGGGGCAVVSDTHGGSGYQVALFVLGVVALCVSRRRQSS